MRDAFLKQLEELHKMLAEMGLLCEKMIDGTYEALTHMDREQAAKILQDDANVDLKERDIESKCLKLLLEQQPVASDLRKISSALKMITDLERIGDQAGDIAEIIKTADLLEPVKATRLGEMAKAVASMVRESVESFANEDLKKTKEVIAYDDVIDDMFSQVKKELADGILNGEATQEQILDILMIAKYYDAQRTLQKIQWADVLIVGSPCYWGNMNGHLKVVFDRIVYGMMGESPKGLPQALHKGKKAVIVSTCSTPWPFNIWFNQTRGVVKALREILKWSGFSIKGVIQKGGTKLHPELTESDKKKCRKIIRNL